MRFLLLLITVTFLITTTKVSHAQNTQTLKIRILENLDLRRRIEKTAHFRTLSRAMANNRVLRAPIYWKFENQGGRFASGEIYFVNQLPISIDTSRSLLSMPLDEYKSLLKQNRVRFDIEVYTTRKNDWFTLSLNEYAVQADALATIAALKQAAPQSTQMSQNEASALEKVGRLIGTIDQARKQKMSVEELRENQTLEAELAKANREQINLRRQLSQLEIQSAKADTEIRQLQAKVTQKTEDIKQLETELGRAKRDKDYLQNRVNRSDRETSQASKKLERLQNSVHKLKSPLEQEVMSLVKAGELDLQIRPANAHIFINDQAVGYRKRLTVHLPVGWHSVKVNAEGYGSQQIMVNIQPEKTLPRTLTLSPQ